MELTKDSIIGLACDHSGFEAQQIMKHILIEKNIKFIDYGTHINLSCDYMDHVSPLCYDIDKGYIFYGLCFCRTGQGVNIAANKHEGIISALVYGDFAAKMAVEHNGANVFCFPGFYRKKSLLKRQLEIILESNFLKGKYLRRKQKNLNVSKL